MLPYYPGCVWRGELLCLFVVVPCCHVDNQFAFHQPSREAKITKTSQTHIYFPSSVSEGGVHTGVPGLCRDPFLNAASPCLSHSICLQLKTRPSNHFFSLFFPPKKTCLVLDVPWFPQQDLRTRYCHIRRSAGTGDQRLSPQGSQPVPPDTACWNPKLSFTINLTTASPQPILLKGPDLFSPTRLCLCFKRLCILGGQRLFGDCYHCLRPCLGRTKPGKSTSASLNSQRLKIQNEGTPMQMLFPG